MTATNLQTSPLPSNLETPREGRVTWALIDVTILFLVIGTASDMLINLGPLRAPIWLLCYGTTLLRMALSWPVFLALLARNRVVLAYPLVCLASVLWSRDPSGTLTSSIQLTMTVLIATYLGWRYSVAVLLKCFAILMTVAAALSLLHGFTGIFPWPTHTGAGGMAGLFQHKNMLGQRSLFAIAIITGLLLLRRDEPGWTSRPVLLLALGLCLTALALSQSMTSVLLVPPMVGLVLLLCLRRVPGPVAVGGLAAGVLLLALAPVLLAVTGVDPVGVVLQSVGKDATLTGRTVLWDIAAGVRADNPILGTGFRAFWTAPEFLNGRLATHEAGARDVASFHNFLLEILVSVGLPGALAILAMVWTAIARLWKLFQRDRGPAVAAGLSIVFGIVVTSLVGTGLYRAHEIMMLLMPMLAVAASEDLRRPASGLQPRP